jgi:2-polyprenyl-3-methyl-5-hydroxy-6-metoxy-1,4-benzoquinol methylase
MTEPDTENYEQKLQESREYWNHAASSFDDEPDHGLRTPLVLEAWTAFLKEHIPFGNGNILDIGCGTGSLSVVLAKLGHAVTGIDLSPSMISLAKKKAASDQLQIDFQVMDAAFPQLTNQKFDLIVCRHLLWTLSEPEQVIQRWIKLLNSKGRLILIEGFWKTGAGLHANEITEMLPPYLINISIQNLSDNPDFWDGNVSDERYAIIADLKS